MKRSRKGQSGAPRERKASQVSQVLRRLSRNKLAMVSLFVVIAIVLCAVFADYIAPYDYQAINVSNRFAYPSAEHWFGTDNYGRDLLSRVIYGGRISLLVSVIAVAFAMSIGCILGSTAAFFGGIYENVVMRIIDMLMAIPTFLLAVCISAALGRGIFFSALAIAVSMVPSSTRLMRSSVLQIRDQEFVEAAEITGASRARIIFHEILPNTLAPIIVDTTLRIGSAIISISGLSFIGLGIEPPTPEWGSILASGREFIRDFWPLVTFPGLAIVITLVAFNLLGDGLRDALDPRLKQ